MAIIQKIENYIDNHSKISLFLTIMTFVCIYSTILMLLPGMPRGHDLTFHLSRILAIKDGLVTGEFPVKIYPGYIDGYGYANGLLYPDLFLYIPAVMTLLGLKLLTSYKVFFIHMHYLHFLDDVLVCKRDIKIQLCGNGINNTLHLIFL